MATVFDDNSRRRITKLSKRYKLKEITITKQGSPSQYSKLIDLTKDILNSFQQRKLMRNPKPHDCLEAKFGEEPFILSQLVTLFQLVFDFLARLLSQSGVAEAILVDLR